MRAELFPRPVTALQVIIVLSLTLIASGCKTEKDPDQPTILGTPPGVAYLGVEYYYNFGAYGGEDILDYSLTNAPSWLALEDTSNKARQGIIMRGVPGLNGVVRSDAELFELSGTNINLVANDGRMAGVQPFNIEVKYNALTLDAGTFKEGESPVIPDTRREHCELPDLDVPGEHSFTVNTYNDDGSVNGTEDLTLPTRPIFVKVLLDRPSVTEVAVAFELTSNYDPTSCDSDPSDLVPPHQRCDHGTANAGEAIVGKDIVALGSGSDSLLEDIPYLAYQTDSSGIYTGGVITLKPGITECYIRLEVVDDRFPEPSEAAQLTLTEVRTGIAALGENNRGVRTSLVIDDNEPKVSLETEAGGTRDALNVGGSRTYVARLTGDRDGEIRAKLGETEDSATRLNTEFTTSLPGDVLVFPPDTNEVTFTLEVNDPASYVNTDPDDRFILLSLNESDQLGRENYARATKDEVLRVSINELTSPLAVGSESGFVPTDIAVGHKGKMFVAGYDTSDNNRVFVYIYDQKGVELQVLEVSASGDSLSAPEPVIGVARREVKKENITTVRYEFVVAYTAEGVVSGTTEIGGKDVVTSLYWYDQASNGGEYVETWTTRTGTTGDDIVRAAGINTASGFVLIAGETDGEWPNQIAAGGFDSFMQRIDTELDGTNSIGKPAWARQVGSSGYDRVAGASAAGLSPLLFGSAQGAVNGEPSLGGEDVYFYTAASADSDLTVRQRGTEADEQIASGVVEGSTLWLLGNGSNQYAVEEGEEDSLNLTSMPGSSQNGFILGYTSEGEIIRSFNLNDDDDTSSEQFSALTGFFGDLIAGGHTDGDFTGSAGTSGSQSGIVTRVSLTPESEPDAETTVYRNEWRFQMTAANSDVTKLANYRDDEIVALARKGADWTIQLLSPEGVLLTP